MDLFPGIYEQVINEYLQSKLSSLRPDQKPFKDTIKHYDPQAILSRYIRTITENALRTAEDKNRSLADQIAICNGVISHLADKIDEKSLHQCKITGDAELLLAILDQDQSTALNPQTLSRPETSISQSSLFTGSPQEPGLVYELKKEINSADQIDLLISFIKWSGIRLILDELKEFVRHGTLRVITTSYTGATEIKAVEVLSRLQNTTVKISYDTERTRLHAKSYIFHRRNGFSTAYIGSSNLSNPAVTSGLEWNVKVTQQDSGHILKKIDATFETYWNDPEFVTYTDASRDLLIQALSKETKKEPGIIPVFDIHPYHFQKEILEQIKAERKYHNNFKNLIVAATGTGKTVISAFDYKDLASEQGHYPRLLFVAHREEILQQSINVFRGVLKDPNFGDLLVGKNQPAQIEYLFTSIQSLNSKDLIQRTRPDYYDVIIIDEFHHAAAPSYQRLLSYYTPRVLIGLTATPERMDGLDILQYFNGSITAEIRLPEAINRKLLSPFHYFGVTDVVDLDAVSWRCGAYNPGELNALYTGNTQRVERIVVALQEYIADIDDTIGLGFCVSVDHAAYMAESFTKAGIPSAYLHANSPHEERFSIQNRLISREIHFIFVVDLYNEGIDIPEVNTILFLRPTESLTIFLQQLGRGLRISGGKECLTVLDFVGRHHANYRFGDKITALLSTSDRPLLMQVADNTFDLPKGCHIHLEKVAQERILENIRSSITTRTSLINNIRTFEERTGKPLTFKNFIEYHSLTPREVYQKDTFYALACQAGVYQHTGSDSPFTRTAALRLCTIDSPRLIQFIQALLDDPRRRSYDDLSEGERHMLTIFYYSIFDAPVSTAAMDSGSLFAGIVDNPLIQNEVSDLLDYTFKHLEFIPESIDLGFDAPLEVHCTYTRDQIFSALGHYTLHNKPSQGSREGVLFLRDKNIDAFLITLNKTEEHYSPTTMYMDYAVSESLFHWQSQSTTSASSPVGERYIHHEERGSKVLLFVREFNKVGQITEPYIFLGTARYLSHEGSRPMSILWELDRPMPPGLFVRANKMVIG
jgi:superfamily II DNA or RNA helicase